MSEDAKRSIQGALAMKPLSSDGRKPSSAADAATPPTGKRVIIKSADMLPEMQKEAVDTAISAFEKHSVEKDVAEHIKKEFDKKHGSTWHCIVGRNFAWIGWVGLFTRQAQPSPALIGSVVSIRFLCDS